MFESCLRHPLRTLNRIRTTLIHRMITANLEQAHEHAVHDNREGFERHCAHAERLAERHAPGRVDDVKRVVAAGPDLLGEATDVDHSEPTTATVNV